MQRAPEVDPAALEPGGEQFTLAGHPCIAHHQPVIQAFGDTTTEDLFHGRRTARTRMVPADIVRSTLRKLDQLNAAHELDDLRSPPGNRLERLRGDLGGFHSIRVNDQWRITFLWTNAGPTEVSLTDYH